jgi:hypothetical protein
MPAKVTTPTKTATTTKIAADPAGARYRAMETAAQKAADIRGISKTQLLQQMQKGPLKPYVAPTKTTAKVTQPVKPPVEPVEPVQPVYQDIVAQELSLIHI